MRRSLIRPSLPALFASLVLLLAALVVIGEPAFPSVAAGPAPAAADEGTVLLVPTPGVGERAAKSSPKLLEAIQRDLRLTRAEAIIRIGRQHAADSVEARARRAAGRHFAGSWLNGDGSALMVAVTDRRAAPAVRAAGATPTVVAHRRGELEAARLKLRAHADELPGTAVHGWYVDLARNRLVVRVATGKERAAARWVAAAGVPAGLVVYDPSRGPQQATADVLGGDGYDNAVNGRQCTAGFGVRPLASANVLGTNGFVTAGHCVDRGNFVDLDVLVGGQGAGRATQSSFPLTPPVTSRTLTFDRAFVQFNTGLNNQALPAVRSGLFTTIPVLGSQAARVGDTVCSFGRFSGFRCGPLIAVNEDLTVTFRDEIEDRGTPTVLGLNTARFCSVGGDSGGPVITMAGQAQGTVVSTTCTGVGFTTTYQPINATQLGLDVRLLLAGSAPTFPAPTIAAFFCYTFDDYYGALFFCDLYWDGGTDPDYVQVSSNGSQADRFNDFDQNYVFVSGRCDLYQDTYVSVTVFDAAGHRVDATQSGFCPRN